DVEVRSSAPMAKRGGVTNGMQSIAINNNRGSLVGSAEGLSEILSAFADNLAPGDSVEIHFVPGDGTAIRINGTTLASGKSAQIFNLFLSSWIGAVPPSSHFKNALLGTANSTADQGRVSTLAPSPPRIAAVKAGAAQAREAGARRGAPRRPPGGGRDTGTRARTRTRSGPSSRAGGRASAGTGRRRQRGRGRPVGGGDPRPAGVCDEPDPQGLRQRP